MKATSLLIAALFLASCGLPPNYFAHPCPPGGGAQAGRPAAAPAASGNGGKYQEDLKYCRSGIDCGSGEFCKDRGDGVHLCMGRGGRNAYCASGIDCGSGMFCKDRGDGLKICM